MSTQEVISHNIAQTSREALASISVRERHTQNDDVLPVRGEVAK